MEAERRKTLEAILARGAFAQAAAMAAQNSDDLKTAIAMLNNTEHTTQEQRIGLLTHMMDLGIIPRRHLNQNAQALLDWLQTRAAPLLPGLEQPTYVPAGRQPPRQLGGGSVTGANPTADEVRRPGRDGTGPALRRTPVSWEQDKGELSGTQRPGAVPYAEGSDPQQAHWWEPAPASRSSGSHDGGAAHHDLRGPDETIEPGEWYRPDHVADPGSWDRPIAPPRRQATRGDARTRDRDDDADRPTQDSWSDQSNGGRRAAEQPDDASRQDRWSDWGDDL